MLSESLKHFENAINRVRKTVAANIVYVILAPSIGNYVVFSDLTGGQSAQGHHSLIERRSFPFGNIVLDSPYLASELVYMGMKSVANLTKRGSLNPRSKLSHESFKLADAAFPGAICRVPSRFLGGPIFAASLQDMQTVASAKRQKSGNNQAGGFSGHFWVILSGVAGWLTYGVFKEWRAKRELEKPYPIGGNTFGLHMTYIV
jgi:hypothetical protein